MHQIPVQRNDGGDGERGKGGWQEGRRRAGGRGKRSCWNSRIKGPAISLICKWIAECRKQLKGCRDSWKAYRFHAILKWPSHDLWMIFEWPLNNLCFFAWPEFGKLWSESELGHRRIDERRWREQQIFNPKEENERYCLLFRVAVREGISGLIN
jgi:hypothetical protein